MVVAVHQPNFFPWLGFFAKIRQADLFLFHDACRNDSKLGWTKRVRIRRGPSQVQWLTFATVKVHRDGEGRYPRLCAHRIADFAAGRREHLRKLEAEYRGAPFFAETLDHLVALYAREEEYLTCFNERCIRSLAGRLGLTTEFRRTSALGVSSSGSQANLDLVRAVGGSVYLSGQGARAYNDEAAFDAAGIELRYQEVLPGPYPQVDSSRFVPGLSILDALFNLGREGTAKLLSGATPAA